MIDPNIINLINNELCIVWNDASEDYFPAEFLRLHSPSAENIGEVDILGQHYGPTPQQVHPGIEINGFEQVGNYALKINFSDGHQTGLYSWDYLRSLRST